MYGLLKIYEVYCMAKLCMVLFGPWTTANECSEMTCVRLVQC